MKKSIILLITFLLLSSCSTPLTLKTDSKWAEIPKAEPLQTIAKREIIQGDIVATINTTKGELKIILETTKAPITTANFIGLAQKGYYDGLIFHRVIPGFMIQWGDPEGNGSGGESIYGNSFEDELDTGLSSTPYTLAMANSGPNTNGSQFFINVADNSFLDPKHSVFGILIEGQDVVDIIVNTESVDDKPLEDVIMTNVLISQYNNWVLEAYLFDEAAAIKNKDVILAAAQTLKEQKLEAKKEQSIVSGDTISMNYVGKIQGGVQFDSSYERGQALEFKVGEGQMIPGVDAGVIGMKIGDKKTLTLEPKDAYGERDEENKQEVEKETLTQFIEAWIALEVWTTLDTPNGPFEILAVSDTTITIDGNFFLAGKALIFDIEIVDIK